MAYFIQLNDAEANLVLVNLDLVHCVRPREFGGARLTLASSGLDVDVQESYETVKAELDRARENPS